MIRVGISHDMLERAKARDTGQMNSRSFQEGRGNIPGFLGEEMVALLRPDWELADTFDYDFDCEGITFDVKTKKQTVNYAPEPDWQAAVANTSLHQDCLIYVFCRVFYDRQTDTYPHGWICGWQTKEYYLEDADKFEVGDPEGDNKYSTNERCLCVAYGDLVPFPLLRGVTPEIFFRPPVVSGILSKFRNLRTA